MASSPVVHILENRVRELLDWDAVFEAVKDSMIAVSNKRAIQTPRTFTKVLGTNDLLLCMPGYMENKNSGTLACKMVTAFTGNEKRDPPLPSILANIFLFDDKTGQLKSIIEASEITAWRTAAASAVATKYLHDNISAGWEYKPRPFDPNLGLLEGYLHVRNGRENNILAILGAGTQGRIHAIAFNHFFKFKQIRIWNHRAEKSQKLVAELKKLSISVVFCESAKDCVENADVIVTATYSSSPLIQLEWIKSNVHINAVGAGTNHHSELSPSIYHNAIIYVDHMESAKKELRGLEQQLKVELKAEIGELITEQKPLPDPEKITVFHSLGMAAEDAAVGQLIFDKFVSQNKN